MQWLAIPFVVLAGVLNTVQSGANAQLGKALGQPLWAAIFVYQSALSMLLLALAALPMAGNGALPSGEAAAGVPWWGWTGGLLGLAFVLSMLLFAERLGSVVFTGVSVTAAILTSMALDHFGLVGFKEHPFNVWRLIGTVLMIGGLGFISVF